LNYKHGPQALRHGKAEILERTVDTAALMCIQYMSIQYINTLPCVDICGVVCVCEV